VRRARFVLPASLALAALLALPAMPVAQAHCDGGEGYIVVVDKCIAQTGIEAAVDALNAASDGSYAFVIAKDQRFHPENVTIRNGGTVVFVWADVFQSDVHDPRNSASTGSQALDMLKPTPPKLWPDGLSGACFDVVPNQDALLSKTTPLFPVSLRYDAGTGIVSVSNSVLPGTPLGAPIGRLEDGTPPVSQPYHDCAQGISSNASDSAVLPYHCGVHGGATTPVRAMRGSIRIEV
jgi:plastocyanin